MKQLIQFTLASIAITINKREFTRLTRVCMGETDDDTKFIALFSFDSVDLECGIQSTGISKQLFGQHQQ